MLLYRSGLLRDGGVCIFLSLYNRDEMVRGWRRRLVGLTISLRRLLYASLPTRFAIQADHIGTYPFINLHALTPPIIFTSHLNRFTTGSLVARTAKLECTARREAPFDPEVVGPDMPLLLPTGPVRVLLRGCRAVTGITCRTRTRSLLQDISVSGVVRRVGPGRVYRFSTYQIR